ncbi:MAG: phosphotransferase, partial [Phenylobacterium sp.]
GRLAGLLDWEDACLGDPMAELAAARCDLHSRFGVHAADDLAKAYADLAPVDRARLDWWDLYMPTAQLTFMDGWGLPPEDLERLRGAMTRRRDLTLSGLGIGWGRRALDPSRELWAAGRDLREPDMTAAHLALLAVGLLSLTTPALPALAGPASDAAQACVNDSSTPEDLDDLMIFSFAAVSKHPKLQPYTTMTSVQRDAIYARAGAILSRIVLVDCREAMIEAIMRDGGPEYRTRINISEPMNRASMASPLVAREISLLRNYIDAEEFQALVEAAKERAGTAKQSAEPAK